MATINKKSTCKSDVRLAGGHGTFSAKSSEESQLRRLVLTCLLWEDNAYISGNNIVANIKSLCAKVSSQYVSQLAIEARKEQKLRHIPLLLTRELVKKNDGNKYVRETLRSVCTRPDQVSEFLSLYWSDNSSKKTLTAQVKLGLSDAFNSYNSYNLAKWNGKHKEIKLRDACRLVHPKPKDDAQSLLFKQLVSDTLPTPDTWEVGLSKAKTQQEKKDVWIRLINEGKLPALAFLKNIRNMEDVKVPYSIIRKAFSNCHPGMLLPIDFIRAYNNSQQFSKEIEELMFQCTSTWPKLTGHTIFVVDTSGSMRERISDKSEYSRAEVASSLAVLAHECCEYCTIYATAGNDSNHIHKTGKVKNVRGFALVNEINETSTKLGGGGIFTQQLCKYLKQEEPDTPDRIIIFSDSQDCDFANCRLPQPHGKRNYIIDVSSHQYGVNYKGVWTAEISGWSESFLKYIANYEVLEDELSNN
jgi:hypothetical protein